MKIDIGRAPKLAEALVSLGPDFRRKAVDVEERFNELASGGKLDRESVGELLGYLPPPDAVEGLDEVDQAVVQVARHCAGQLVKAAKAAQLKVPAEALSLLQRYAGDDFEDVVEPRVDHLEGVKKLGSELEEDLHGNFESRLREGYHQVAQGKGIPVGAPVKPAGNDVEVIWKTADVEGVPCTLIGVYTNRYADRAYYLDVPNGPLQGQYEVDVSAATQWM